MVEYIFKYGWKICMALWVINCGIALASKNFLAAYNALCAGYFCFTTDFAANKWYIKKEVTNE